MGKSPINSSPTVPEPLPHPKSLSVVSNRALMRKGSCKIDNRGSYIKIVSIHVKQHNLCKYFGAVISIPLTRHLLSVPSLTIILFSSRWSSSSFSGHPSLHFENVYNRFDLGIKGLFHTRD